VGPYRTGVITGFDSNLNKKLKTFDKYNWARGDALFAAFLSCSLALISCGFYVLGPNSNILVNILHYLYTVLSFLLLVIATITRRKWRIQRNREFYKILEARLRKANLK
jgi:hypothetical protein